MTTDTPTRPAISEDERNIRLQLARGLWTLDQGDDLPKDAAARKDAFVAVRKEYMRKAARLSTRLPRRGVALSWTGKTEADSDA